MPNSTVVLRFVAPLLLWAVAVVVVFGVSFTQLANLQGPLSSLNAAAHVNYRVSRVRLQGGRALGPWGGTREPARSPLGHLSSPGHGVTAPPHRSPRCRQLPGLRRARL
jgi:hypothetical protein